MTTKDVLIVDDQREVRRMLRAALESISPNIQVQDIPSAEEALYLLSRQLFQLLVADIRLAGMSGIELVEKVRQVQPGIKIIMITGLTDEKILRSVAQAPIEAWFPKPVDVNAFLQRATQLIELESSGEAPAPISATAPSTQSVPPDESLTTASFLHAWREQLQLECLLEFDYQGFLLGQAGELPPEWKVSALFQFFMEVDKAVRSLQNRFGAQRITPIIPYLAGDFIAGCLSCEASIFIFITQHHLDSQDSSASYQLVVNLIERLSQLIHLTTPLNIIPVTDETHQSSVLDVDQPPDPNLELLLNGKEKPVIALSNAHEFWDQAETTIHLSEDINNKTLDFEEARRLGLTNEPT